MKVCFIGHRNIEVNEELLSSLKETIKKLINNGATTFLFGSKSQFDNSCWDIVTSFKTQYPEIKRIYVRSAFQHLSKSYTKYLLEYYEETYFPPKLENAGKYSYVERNYEMIDKSNFCVFYYNANYTPLKKRNSGTKIAYDYAVKKKKNIINLFNKKD